MGSRRRQCLHEQRYNSINGEICDDCGDILITESLDTSPQSLGSQPSHREKRIRRLLVDQLHQPSEYVNEVIARFNAFIQQRSSRSIKQPLSHAIVLMLLYIVHRENDKVYPIFSVARQLAITSVLLRNALRKVGEIYSTSQLPKITAVNIAESMLDDVNLSNSAIKSIGKIYDILADDHPDTIVNTEPAVTAYGLVFFYLVDGIKRDITYDSFLNTFEISRQRSQITKVLSVLRSLKLQFQHK